MAALEYRVNQGCRHCKPAVVCRQQGSRIRFAAQLSKRSTRQQTTRKRSGTEGRSRTDTGFTPPDFESGASTSSATPAQGW